MDGTILIADDDRSIRTVLTQALTRAGCRVHATGSLQQLLKWVNEGRGDLVVTDVMMPDGNGIDMIPAIRKARPELPVIVISAQNTIVTAIRATEAEAFDYLPKPFDLPDLLARARDALSRRPRLSDAPPEPRPIPSDTPELPLIGHAPPMQAMFRLVARLLNADLAVVIAGAPGTGKTTLARALHEMSDRAAKPLHIISPADDASEALERHVAEASGGTLVIENPSGFDANAQMRLQGLLDRAASLPDAPRIIATTGPNPQAKVESGALRGDLYYRLAGAVIDVPSLAERRDDIPALAAHLLARAAAQGLSARSLDDQAIEALRAADYPGNVRQLENMLRRLALTGTGPITAKELASAWPDSRLAADAPPRPATRGGEQLSASVAAHLQHYFDLHGDCLPPPGLYDRVLREIEAPLLEIALDATGGNQLRCAALLGINRNTLRKKLNDLNIQVTRRRRVM